MSAVLIIGASSAIGRSVALHYLQHGAAVIWLSRTSADFSHPQLTVIQAPDLAELDDWTVHQQFFDALLGIMQQHKVRTIFNCIGWLHQQQDEQSALQQRMPEKSLNQSSAVLLQQTLQLNLHIPVFYLQGLWPYLAKTAEVRYLQLSAKVGSISDNKLGGWYSYRSAKAALNQWLRTASIELMRSNKSAVLVSLHPGTTDSPLSAPFQRNLPAGQLQTPAQTAAHLVAVAQQLIPAQSGLLLSWDGTVIPF